MNTVIESLREFLGEPDFYHSMTTQSNPTWDYGAMLEYALAGMLLLIVVGSVFKIIRGWFSR